MNTDDLTSAIEKSSSRKHRAWYLLAGILALVSIIFQQPLILLAALFALILGMVPAFWNRHALRHLVIHYELDRREALFGDEITLSLAVENRKFLPLPWLRIDIALTPPLTILSEPEGRREKLSLVSETWLLLPFQSITRRYHLLCHARGSYTLGPAIVRSSDPFGWRECELSLPLQLPLIVYPPLIPVETPALVSLHPFGEYTTNRPLVEDPLRVIGVRGYSLGDDLRHIHWKASVRTGKLQSKIYAYSSMQRLLILLDAWNYSPSWRGTDPEVQELSIAIAASLALRGIEEGAHVALLSNTPIRAGKEVRAQFIAPSLPFGGGTAQAQRILAALAELQPYEHIPLTEAIHTHRSLFIMGTTILVVSAITSLTETTLVTLLDLQQRGIPCCVFATGEGQLPACEDLPVHYAGGKETWYEYITSIGSANNRETRLHTGVTRLD